MAIRNIELVGIPMDSGKRRPGCLMGPDAFRTAGLLQALRELGHRVNDVGNLCADDVAATHEDDDGQIFARAETIGWTRALTRYAQSVAEDTLPIYMGGDHALALGTVVGSANRAAKAGKPFFVLWLDAHADFNTPLTSTSGNLHGTPMAYATGQSGFDGFDAVAHPVRHENICLMGLRSVDLPEKEMLQARDMAYVDMRAIDEHGIVAPLRTFLEKVEASGGALHVSLDVDFLDPSVAPAVGTTVPGGATSREAHLIMELLHDSGLMSSLDLVELNPFLDERGKTASLMVDLTASALGRRIFDRPTSAFA